MAKMILPMSSQEFKREQIKWYAILRETGFEDIEDHTLEDKPLKRWSGIPVGAGAFDVVAQQAAGTPIQSSFPEKRFVKEDKLLNHPDFALICISICGHGNNKLDPGQVRDIWERYLEGATNRGIAGAININYVTVYRCIATLSKWAETMGEENADVSTVVVRPFDPERDAAMLFSTWRNSLWFDTPGRDETKNHKFFRDCTRLIKTILSDPGTRVNVACLSDDDNLILGAAVINKTNLVWVYIKADYRRRGIATILTRGCETISNPSTSIGRSIARDKNLKVKDE